MPDPRDHGQPPAYGRLPDPAQAGHSTASRRPRPPGYDEITVAAPPAPALCSSAEHRRLYVLAEAVITFGELGVAWQQDAIWMHNWGKSFSLCRECLSTVIRFASSRRPGLKITDTRAPSTASGNPTATGQDPAGH